MYRESVAHVTGQADKAHTKESAKGRTAQLIELSRPDFADRRYCGEEDVDEGESGFLSLFLSPPKTFLVA
jgi:hypothetical protein